MTDSAGGLGMSDLKFMGHAAGMTNIEVAQSLEYNARRMPRVLLRRPSWKPRHGG